MFEGILYFVLGFLCSTIIALMVSPAIWNRAVQLTKRRIESTLPLTLNEIQAEKDQLRAEFAMSSRRLEMAVEQLNETVSSQRIELNRKRDEMAKLTGTSQEHIQAAEELQAKSVKNRSLIAQTIDDLKQTKEQLKDRTTQLEEIRARLDKVQSEFDATRIELVARQTELDSLSDELKDHTNNEQELAKELEIVKKQLARAEQQIAVSNDSKDQQLGKLQQLNSDLSEQLKNSELNNNHSDLEKTIEEISSERDAFKQQLGILKLTRDEPQNAEDWENQQLRERINDLAAQVTAMTAALEGPDSPINSILDNAPKSAPKLIPKSGPIKGRKPDPNHRAKRGKQGLDSKKGDTLADRMRALQETARAGKTDTVKISVE